MCGHHWMNADMDSPKDINGTESGRAACNKDTKIIRVDLKVYKNGPESV
jgi:hypothetical protein